MNYSDLTASDTADAVELAEQLSLQFQRDSRRYSNDLTATEE